MRKSIKINYNNKIYQMFIDKKIYFLRIETIKDKQIYFNLNLNEYITLNKKFNEMNSLIFSINNNIMKIKIKLTGLIILPIFLSFFESDNNYVLVKNNNIKESKIRFSTISTNNNNEDYYIDGNTTIIYTNDGLDEFLKYKNVSFNELRNTLNENININNIDKDILNNYINELEIKFPNIDLRCFNENLKVLTINNVSKETMKEKTTSENYNGYFDPVNHEVLVRDDLTSKQYFKVITHEFTHMLNNMIIIKDNQKIIKRSYKNNAELYVSEGFNEYINSYLFNSNIDYQIYKEQVDDVSILVNIFGNEILDDYLNENVGVIEEKLSSYIGEDNASDLINTMATEVISLSDDSVVLNASTIVNKYDLLMKCYLTSKNNQLTSSEIEVMKNLIIESASIYQTETFVLDEFYGLNTEIKDIVSERMDSYFISNNLTNSVDITFNNKVIGNYELSKLYLMIDYNNEFKIVSLESNQSGVYAYDIIANESIIDLSSDKLEKIDFLEEEINESIDINVLYEKCSEYLSTNKTK